MRYQLNAGVIQTTTLIILTLNYCDLVNSLDNIQDELINPQDTDDSNIHSVNNNLERSDHLNQNVLQRQDYNKPSDLSDDVNERVKEDGPNETKLESDQVETSDYRDLESEVIEKNDDPKMGNDHKLDKLIANYKQLATVTISNELKKKVDSNEALNGNDLDELGEWVNEMQAYLNSFPRPDKSKTLEAIQKYDREREDEDYAVEAGFRGPVETDTVDESDNTEGKAENSAETTASDESEENTSEAPEEIEGDTSDTEEEATTSEAAEEETEVTKRIEKKKVLPKQKGYKLPIPYTNKLNNLIWAIGGLLVIVLIMVVSIYSFVIKPSKKKVKHYEPVPAQFTF